MEDYFQIYDWSLHFDLVKYLVKLTILTAGCASIKISVIWFALDAQSVTPTPAKSLIH